MPFQPPYYHLWIPLLVWGGMLEYPLYLASLLSGNYPVFALLLLLRTGYSWIIPSLFTRGSVGKHDVRHLPAEPDYDAHQLIQLIHPHGFFCEAGVVFTVNASYDPKRKKVLFLDKLLYHASPLGIKFLEALLGISVTYLDNKNIRKHLEQGFSCGVFAGGFKEVVGFDEEEELINTNTYGYWFRVGREYNTRVFSSIIYDGSVRYFSQSGVMKKQRLGMASAKIPILLPSAVRNPGRDVPIYVRHIDWTPDQIERCDTKEVKDVILRVVEEDRAYHRGRSFVVSNL